MNKKPLAALALILLAINATANEKITGPLQHSMSTKQALEIPVIVFLNQNISRQTAAALAETANTIESYKNLNAFAAELTPVQIKTLAQNPSTEKIFLAGSRSIAEKSVALGNSTQAVGAQQVWALGYSGKNITVSVIDTGIDYRHPDLGNCTNISPSCRVRGGYDYYNNDTDPMDDNSHGTHCAGIIGANGTIMGVAPQAKFLAYKVCDASGQNCPDIEIISAIDASIDEGADVISMSLAGPLQPNDGTGAIEHALGVASDLGVISAIAAGNHGDGTGSLESPADAENAISVGISDDQDTPTTADDNIVYYSCRGPAAFGRAAPDLVAPGANIYSTVPGNTYGYKSGTSMATPHVAGAAALLLDYNGNLTPAEVRKLLKQSTTDLHDHTFSQGAGALNISRAITQTINASIHKWESLTLPGWNATTNLSIQNRGNTTLQINFTAGNLTDLEGDYSISSSNIILPEQANLSANSTTTFNITITVPSNASAGVYGTTLAATSGDNQTLRIPVALSILQVGGGIIHGSIDDGGTLAGGDTITIPLKPALASRTVVDLNYTASNVHLYVYTVGSQLAGYDNDTGNPKTVTISNVTQETYWILLHGYVVSDQQYYDLKISDLSKPILAQPQNLTNDSQVALNWTASTSTVYIIYYNISWSQNQNYTNESSIAANGTNTTLNLSDGVYFARVSAVDANGISSEWSDSINFTVDTTPPTTPEITPVDSVIHNDTLNITWNQSDDNLSGVSQYALEISTSENFTNLTYAANTSNSSAITTVLYDNRYFARVRAVDAAGNSGGWSSTINFTVTTIALNEFLPNPGSGSQWVELYNVMEKNHSLAGWTLGSTSANATLSNTITGRGYLLLYSNETNLTLNPTGGSLHLWNPSGVLIDNASYANATAGYSVGRMQDGVGAFITFPENQTTPGAANTQSIIVEMYLGWNLISLPFI